MLIIVGPATVSVYRPQSLEAYTSYTSTMPILKIPKFFDKLLDVAQAIPNKQREQQDGAVDADQFPPASSISQSNPIPRKILAFRLITKMLARIETAHPFPAVDNLTGTDNGWQSSERQEVKISDAFAHLAVVEHDIVAISTNYRSRFSPLEANDPMLDGNLNVMACSTPDNVLDTTTMPDSDMTTITPPEVKSYAQGLAAFAGRIFNVLASKNDSEDDLTQTIPTIVKPVQPSDFVSGSLDDYMKNLETNWYVLFCSLIANVRSHPYIVGVSHHCHLIYGSWANCLPRGLIPLTTNTNASTNT